MSPGIFRRSFKTRSQRKPNDDSPIILRNYTTKPNKALKASRRISYPLRSQDDIEAVRHPSILYHKDDELRRSTGSIYGAESPTKSKPPPGMHVRSNSDTSEITFAQLKNSYELSVTEPRSPTGESFFAIVQRFEQNIKNEGRRSTKKGGVLPSVVDGSTFIENLREYNNHASGSPTIEKKTPILRRKNSLRSNTTSFFRTKKNYDSKEDTETSESAPTRKYLAHYDCQSLTVNYEEQVNLRTRYGDGMKRKNTRSGASAASAKITAAQRADQMGSDSSLDNPDDALDYGDNKSSELVQSCPFFRNELGGEDDMDPQISLSRDNTAFQNPYDSSTPKNEKLNALKRRSTLDILLTAYDSARRGNLSSGTAVTILDNSKPESGSLYLGEGGSWSDDEGKIVFEHADHGAYYYRNFFVGQEHLTYLGTDEKLGPVAISLKREKLDENTSLIKNDAEVQGTQYQYRIIIRTSHLTTVRGSILEESVPSTSRHGTARALPAKDILEYVAPEIQQQCLRQAAPGIKVPELLMKVDEQGMTNQYKVGILYCKAGQSTEEEMYNNQVSGPAFDEFLDLIGKKVRLKGFTNYKAQLDNRNDSTGEYSLYTTFHNREIMFHVSTLLPWTPNNKQQLLRKRHIGNDIVTIVFQEPGALPFTPKNIRSHFQHVFIVIQVFNACSETTYYKVAVSRSKDVPPFGPPIPAASKFGKQKAFANFLLTKIINAENAAHKSEKFSTMATRTRHEYLKDLSTNYVTNITLDTGSSKSSFGKFSLSGKKKEKIHHPISTERVARGGLVWNVEVEDYRNSTMIECIMAISSDTLVLIDSSTKESLFSISSKATIGWTPMSSSIKVFYGGGDCLVLNIPTSESDDLPEIVRRLESVTIGCQTQTITLRRNIHGQLGFHVQYEGLVADVEVGGYAWQAGLRHGCRLVEINGLIVATLTHEQMIEILRKPGSVTVVMVSPLPSGKPRKGVHPSNYQYWWSARSSTSTISSCGGSLTSVGEDHESRDHSSLNLKNPPRAPPKYHKRTREENNADGSSMSSVTGSSSTLNEETSRRLRTPSYGAAFSVTSVNPIQELDFQELEKTPVNNQGSQGSSSSYENLNTPRPKWSGISPVPETVQQVPSSVGVTLKAPTSKGTLYVIASGPQSPGVSPKSASPETPLFGSISQRGDRHRRVYVDEHGKVIGGDTIAVELQLTKNGEIDSKQVYAYDSVSGAERDQSNGDKVPYKETTLGAVITTTSTYTQDNEELSEASMTETMDKIEKAFAFKTPDLKESPRYDYGQFDRTSNVRRSECRSPRGSTEDLKVKQKSSESLNRSELEQTQNRKDSREQAENRMDSREQAKAIVAHEVKSEMARALSHEELQVQLILQELQQAEKDLGGTEGRIEVQTVVEMSRGNNEVIRESTPKNKEYDSRLAQRNTVMERVESQRHAIGGDKVEGLKIYHAKSRSSPADVSKDKQNSSQTDLTGRSKSDQERNAVRGTKENELVQRRQSRRRRSERLEQAEGSTTPDASRTAIKPVVRSERKIKLSTSGITDEKASTLPRCKSHRKTRPSLRQFEESESTDEDYRARERSKTDTGDAQSAGVPRDGGDRRRSFGETSSSVKSPSHMKGDRLAKLKMSSGEEPNELVNQTARLLNASEETKHDSNFKISQDVLHSLAQASDLLKNRLPAKEERERENRGRDREGENRGRDREGKSERSRDREKERKDKSVSKMKSHGRGKSHGPHKFHIPVVPRRHSFDDRIIANSVSKSSGGESSFTRESIGREAELEMKLAIVSNALMKEGEEKQRLESDLKKAAKENRKLQENLQTASIQLRKFTEWFFSNVDQSKS